MRHTWRECAFVFAGAGVAASATGVSVALGWSLESVGPVWLGALVWTFVATIAHVLWRGFRRGDWSGVRNYVPPDHRARDRFDWETRSGAYAYMRILEDTDRLMRGRGY